MKILFALLVTFVIICTCASTSLAQNVPQMVNYQGRLTNDTGDPIDTTVAMTFTIYDQEIEGAEIWTETQSAVVVTEGLFNVILGGVNLVTDTIFNSDSRYLGIQVGDDPEIEPRTRLVTAPYAFNAGKLDGWNAQEIIDLIPPPPPLTPSGEFWAYAESTPGTDISVHTASGLTEITSISITTNSGTKAWLKINSQYLFQLQLSEVNYPNNQWQWYKGNGAGIFLEDGQTLKISSQGGPVWILITGFE